MEPSPGSLTLQELAGENSPSPDLETPDYASSFAASIVASRLGESAVEHEYSFVNGLKHELLPDLDSSVKKPGQDASGHDFDSTADAAKLEIDDSQLKGENSVDPLLRQSTTEGSREIVGTFRGVQLSPENMALLSKLSLDSEMKRQRVMSDLRKAGENASFASSLFSAPTVKMNHLTIGQTKTMLHNGIQAYITYLEALVKGASERGQSNAADSQRHENASKGSKCRIVSFITQSEADSLNSALVGPRTGASTARLDAVQKCSDTPVDSTNRKPNESTTPFSASKALAPRFLRFDGFLRDTYFPRVYGSNAGGQRAADLLSALERYGREPDGPCVREALVVRLALELYAQGPERVLHGVQGIWEQVGGGSGPRERERRKGR